MRYRRKGSASYYKKKADDLVAMIVKVKGKCDKCGRGSGVQLQCAHIVGRNNHSLRFDLKNVLCLCAGCHRWGHDNPDKFTDFWRKKYPFRRAHIDLHRNEIVKRKVHDYKDLVEELKEIYERKLVG